MGTKPTIANKRILIYFEYNNIILELKFRANKN